MFSFRYKKATTLIYAGLLLLAVTLTVDGASQDEFELKLEEARADLRANQAKAEDELTNALNRFMLVVENYPDLKASQNFLSLQEELSSTENKVSFARQFYNDQVQAFNIKIESVPTNIIAGMFNFNQAEFFEIEAPAEREAPKVEF